MEMLVQLYKKFLRDDTPSLAASLAFYTTLSIAPLLVIFMTISARLSESLQQNLVAATRQTYGDQLGQAVEMMIGSQVSSEVGTSASALGAFGLLISASLIFAQLRMNLNKIFKVEVASPPEPLIAKILSGYLKEKALHVFLAVSLVVVLIASLLASTALTAVLRRFFGAAAAPLIVVENVGFYLLLFTLVYRLVPARHLPWKRAAQGGLLTAILFVVGMELIRIYIERSLATSSYGAAGSVVVLLLWFYYSALITFMGAQMSYLKSIGSRTSLDP